MARYRVKTRGSMRFTGYEANSNIRRAIIKQSVNKTTHTIKTVGTNYLKIHSSDLKKSSNALKIGAKNAAEVAEKTAGRTSKAINNVYSDKSVEQKSADFIKDVTEDTAKDANEVRGTASRKIRRKVIGKVRRNLRRKRELNKELRKGKKVEALKLKNGQKNLKFVKKQYLETTKKPLKSGRKLKKVNENTAKVLRKSGRRVRQAEKLTKTAAKNSAKAAVKSANATAKTTKVTVRTTVRIVKAVAEVTGKLIEITISLVQKLVAFIVATAEITIPVIAVILVVCIIFIAVGRIIVLFNPDNSTLQGVAAQCMTKYNMWTDAIPALVCDLSDGSLDNNFANFAEDCFDGNGNFDTDSVIDQVIDNTGWVDWQFVLAVYAVELGSEEGIESNRMTNESARILKRVFTDIYLGTDVDWDEADDGIFPDLTVTDRLEYDLGFEFGDADEGFEWSWNPREIFSNAVDSVTTVQLIINATPASVEDIADEYNWGDVEWGLYNEFINMPNPLWNMVMTSYPLGTNDPASFGLACLGKGFRDLWDGEPYDWCARFVTEACMHTGLYGEDNYYYGDATGLSDFHTGSTWVDAWFFVAQNRGVFELNTGRSGYIPQRGDLILFNRGSSLFEYDFDNNAYVRGSLSHIAIVLSFTEHSDGSITITYVGGNQSYEGSSGAANNRVTQTTIDLEALNSGGGYKVYGFVKPYYG